MYVMDINSRDKDSPLLKISEVVEMLRVHTNTLRLWDQKGILPAIRIGERGLRRYKLSDIQDFIESQEPLNFIN